MGGREAIVKSFRSAGKGKTTAVHLTSIIYSQDMIKIGSAYLFLCNAFECCAHGLHAALVQPAIGY